MKILAIETSCDDTAISIVDVKGSKNKPVFKILAHNISSQTKIHEKWGGVVPSLAKREHGRNLVPLLFKSLKDAQFFETCPADRRVQLCKTKVFPDKKINKLLDREVDLQKQFWQEIPSLKVPKIDAIAVTKGPGLEPALWVGINFAKALALVWDKPLYPINHLEGHILASLASHPQSTKQKAENISFPAISLIVSGGHTELVLSRDWLKYKIVGRTRDDAVGEAFDKVARLLGLPYPGGREISKLALKFKHSSRKIVPPFEIKLPRPMLNSGDLDFSFSGIKTAVLYLIQKLKLANKFDNKIKIEIAHEFQKSITEVIIAKTFKAIDQFKARTLVVGGGVIANPTLRQALQQEAARLKIKVLIPEISYSTDNASMIAVAAGFRLLAKKSRSSSSFKAEGNLNLK